MTQLKPGVVIGIPCEVLKGPFSGENLISFDTLDGPVSGFVRDENLKTEGKMAYVRAEVLRLLDANTMEVRVAGSFFTTNGIATIPQKMALAA
jgi:hypothetical protein